MPISQDEREKMCPALQEIFDDGFRLGVALAVFLTQKLTEANRLDDLERAASDSQYRKELFQEFHIDTHIENL